MKKFKKFWMGFKGIVKGIFDADITSRVSGCCGGYISDCGLLDNKKNVQNLKKDEEK
ncbi:MAG: hypothetical protein LBV16_08430 [Elusimicrobiota bacterium]|jgi:hypothetical protein|nr:hypothetical protein [Elusimicrobiota bacterium]